MFKGWNLFEKILIIVGTIVAVIITFVFKGTWIDLGYTLFYFWTAILLAKGKYSCYIIGILSTIFYSIVAYTNAYYGEVIMDMGGTLPLMIVGLVNWLKHQDNTNTVIIKDMTKKELIIMLLSQVILFTGYYYLLKAFNTANVLASTFSMTSGIIATYLTARRSEYGFIAFIINDIFLIILWGIPVVQGNLNIIPVVLCPILLLINDIYGVFNWKIIKKEQKENGYE